MRARYYDPATGQFLTPDPLQGLTRQRYAYALNQPTDLLDPTGLYTAGVCGRVNANIGPFDFSVSGCAQISSSGDVGVTARGSVNAPSAEGVSGSVYYEGSNANYISQLGGPFVQTGGYFSDGVGGYVSVFQGCADGKPIYGYNVGPTIGEGAGLQAGGNGTLTVSVNLPKAANALWHGAKAGWHWLGSVL